jgi:hypothetical protein
MCQGLDRLGAEQGIVSRVFLPLSCGQTKNLASVRIWAALFILLLEVTGRKASAKADGAAECVVNLESILSTGLVIGFLRETCLKFLGVIAPGLVRLFWHWELAQLFHAQTIPANFKPISIPQAFAKNIRSLNKEAVASPSLSLKSHH